MNKIRVMIADDQAIVAQGLGALLSVEDDMEVVKIVDNGQKVLEELEKQPVDVILMDIRMPVMNGVECTGHVCEKYPNTKVLILTTFDDDDYIRKAIGNGASGYMLKDLTAEKLTAAVRNVHIGNSVLDHLITKKIVGNTGVIREKRKSIRTENGEVLTTREMDILKLVARGLNNTEIADALCLSLGTVKNYITALYDKPGIKGRPKLMSFAIDNGLMGDGGST
jgi:DNA-binding NarL/FixJ family response regulator